MLRSLTPFINISLLFFTISSCNTDKSHQSSSHSATHIKDQFVLIKLVYGNIYIKLFYNKAPSTVKRFVTLINSGLYDGLIFHRVIPGYIVQSGDPTNTGDGGTGVLIKDEISNLKHVKGSLAMAKKPSLPDSADSQFYISLNELPELDNKYTIFGKVIKGLEILDEIKKGDKILSISLTSSSPLKSISPK